MFMRFEDGVNNCLFPSEFLIKWYIGNAYHYASREGGVPKVEGGWHTGGRVPRGSNKADIFYENL